MGVGSPAPVRMVTAMTAPDVAIKLNGERHEITSGGPSPTVTALLAQLELAGQRVAVEVNGEVVPRADHAAHALQDGDQVEVVTFVGGG